MVLIIGGAYNGKLTYALENFGLSKSDCIDLAAEEQDRAAEFMCAYHLEALTRCAAENGKTTEEVLAVLATLDPNAVIISREIGSGVVPIDKIERAWRELHGEVLRVLARRAESVIRVFYGIAEVLK